MISPLKNTPQFILFYLFLILSISLNATDTTRVLYISSYHASYPITKKQIKGIEEYINERVQVDLEFMDTKRLSSKELIHRSESQLALKLESLAPYDLIFSADDNALIFIKNYREKLFLNTPIVFLGINKHDLGKEMSQYPNITGIIECASVNSTISLIKTILPKTKRIHVLNDHTTSSIATWNPIKEIKKTFSDIEIKNLDLGKISYEQLSSKLEQIPKEEPVLILSFYRDINGENHSFFEGLEILKKSCKSPLFTLQEHGLGEGIIGGNVVSHREQAKIACIYANKILEGEAVEQLELKKGPNNIILDYNELNRFKIDTKLIPDNAILINTPQISKIELNKHSFILVISSISIGFFIAGLLIAYIRFKQINNELKESESRYTTIFKNRYIPMLLTDPESKRILDANPAALKLYKYSLEEICELEMRDISLTKNQKIDGYIQETKTNESKFVQAKHKDSKGQVINVDIYGGLFYIKKKPVMHFIIHDANQRLEWEKNIIAAKEDAEQANRAKDTFLALMSHELRTPLNPILGFAGIIKEQDISEDINQAAYIIEESSKKMLGMVTNILDFTHLSKKLIQQNSEDFSLIELINNTISEFKDKLNENKLYIENGIAGRAQAIGEGLCVHNDQSSIKKILRNIINNAIKYTEKGKIHVRFGILKDLQQNTEILVEVEDDGIGISEEMQKLMFTPFKQADSSFTRNYEGTGISLAVCSKMLKMMEGEIGVKSQQNKGSIFWFKLPLNVIKQATSKAIEEVASSALNNQTILLVEDNEDNVTYILNALDKTSIKIEVARNGKEALENLKQKHIDLILMDLSMPVMNGFDATGHIRKLKNNKANTPIIALTAHISEGVKRKCKEHQFNDFLEKPVSPDSIKKALQKWL